MNTPIPDRQRAPSGRLLHPLRGLAALVVLHGSLTTSAAPVEPPTTTVSLPATSVALRVVAAAVDACRLRSYNVSATVVARDGSLMAFLRSPLAAPHTIEVSRRKAYTATTLRASTSQLASRPDLSFAPELLLISGGLPLCAGGKCLGGVAVAGADPAVDEQCAQAGIDAVKDELELGDLQ